MQAHGSMQRRHEVLQLDGHTAKTGLFAIEKITKITSNSQVPAQRATRHDGEPARHVVQRNCVCRALMDPADELTRVQALHRGRGKYGVPFS